MNKAFVREPDTTDVLCPRCAAVGIPVIWATVEAHIPAEQRRALAATSYFCETPSCPVAYFDALETCVTVEHFIKPVYPKDQNASLCACFGLSKHDVEDDCDERTPRRIRELLAKSKSPGANCAITAPSGRCCIPEVQKYYFKKKASGG